MNITLGEKIQHAENSVNQRLQELTHKLQRLSQTPDVLYQTLKEGPSPEWPSIATEQSGAEPNNSFVSSTKTPSENKGILCCCSRPLSTTVDNNQNSKLGVLSFIQKLFRISNRKPCDVVPDGVPCSKLIAALEKYFMRRTNCRRGFTPTNRAFLRSKLLKYVEAKSDQDPFISLKRLCEKEEGCSFTFCKWFTGIIEVVNAHLRPYWENGYIVGFIDRLATEELLSKVPHDGAFIVRFSESVLSSITLSYVLKIGKESITASLAPFTCDQLKSISLPEISFGRFYHRHARKGLTMVYFYQVSTECERLAYEHKSVAFPPLLNKEKAEKPTTTTGLGYVQYEQVLVVANPEDAEAAENFHSDFNLDQCLAYCSIAEDLIAPSASNKC